MSLSPTGKKKLGSYALIIALDVAVLALSVLVNIFQEFFFMADLLPLLLSILTLATLLLQVAFDLTSENAFTARPVFEIPLLGTLTVVWLASNSFTMSMYSELPNCSVFYDDVPDELAWCRNAQALRVIVWIEWIALLFTTLMISRISIVQSRRGNTAIWHTALSRYPANKKTEEQTADASSFYRGSSIFGFDRDNGHQKDLSMTSRDWFAPSEPTFRSSEHTEERGNTIANPFFGAGRNELSAGADGALSAVHLQQEFQTPVLTRDPSNPQTIDGFEIVSDGYYFQQAGNWNQGGPRHRS